VKQGERENTT